MTRIRAKPIGKPITPPIQEDEYGDLSISGAKIKDATIDHATKLTNVLPDQHHKKTTDASEITSGRFTMARMPDGTAGYYLKAQGLGVDPVYASVPVAAAMIMPFAAGGDISYGVKEYLGFGYCGIIENRFVFRACRSGTAKNLAVNVPENKLDANTVVTFRRNNAPTVLTVTIGAYASGNFPIVTDSVSFTSADVLSMEVNTLASTSGYIRVNASVELA